MEKGKQLQDKRTEFSVRPIIKEDQQQIRMLALQHWGETAMVVHGEKYNMTELPGYLAFDTMRVLGFVTFTITDGAMEIISLDSFAENRGVGSKLLTAVIHLAVKRKLQRLHLTTTNDNIRALEFYQKRGFSLAQLCVGAVNDARKLKPSIPVYSPDGIRIEHELVLDYRRLL
ncbi:GNAT family N-acetyltransferase [Sporolactobacillus sp. CQH2019]|uniref:GNAT family N-acetyltransferase n=1 Tax=Sporolactobacillus sp. CQH2019 TaxID=3023512 RepID=UPI0023674523|nr:GNAT family N-acetyltransferase [Sporolactobacillus sp. CQH2019]MDD9148816.1 GNAT family N-acetyltransferase [Sporolactobacillus sp. CQH2019]